MGTPLFWVVMQEKEHCPVVLGSVSAHSVINSPVLGAQAEPPWQGEVPAHTGTNTSQHHRHNHCLCTEGRKNCENKTGGQKLPRA